LEDAVSSDSKRKAKGAIMSTMEELKGQKNVLGGNLELCCKDPVTGFFRTGRCHTGPEDHGSHTVCVRVTAEFLAFSAESGNDLSTPRPEYGFVGLRPGDQWCVCAPRWKEALDAGQAAPIILASTHEKALEFIDLEDLMSKALDVH
jgi:uncharacterized protein (DUF2237 family)